MGLAYEFVESLLIYYEHGWHEKEYEYEVGEAWFKIFVPPALRSYWKVCAV